MAKVYNAIRPQITFKFVHVSAAGKITKKNTQTIGLNDAKQIIRRVEKSFTWNQITQILDKIKEDKLTVKFGLGTPFEVVKEITPDPEMFFIQGI